MRQSCSLTTWWWKGEEVASTLVQDPLVTSAEWFEAALRYAYTSAAEKWSKRTKIDLWLRVIKEVAMVQGGLGIIPHDHAVVIYTCSRVTLEQAEQGELETKGHDFAGCVLAIRKNLIADGFAEAAASLYKLVTSYDIEEPATSIRIVNTLDLIIAELRETAKRLREQAAMYKMALQIGRTHGVQAEPITFGFTLLSWLDEVERNIAALERERIEQAIGKLSGTVGVYSQDPRVEQLVCERLGLVPLQVSTQIVPIDIRARYVSALTFVARMVERFSTNIRLMQITEILEVTERLIAGGKGSSAMPHKQNPDKSEQRVGIARVVSALLMPMLESIPTWFQRDLTGSSVERIVLPLVSVFTHYIVRRFNQTLDEWQVNTEKMLRNLNLLGGAVFSQQLQTALKEEGVGAEEAYFLIQRYALMALEGGDFRILVSQDPVVRAVITPRELEQIFNPANNLQYLDTIFARFGINEVLEKEGEA